MDYTDYTGPSRAVVWENGYGNRLRAGFRGLHGWSAGWPRRLEARVMRHLGVPEPRTEAGGRLWRCGVCGAYYVPVADEAGDAFRMARAGWGTCWRCSLRIEGRLRGRPSGVHMGWARACTSVQEQ